jgi:hypothetical protein
MYVYTNFKVKVKINKTDKVYLHRKKNYGE